VMVITDGQENASHTMERKFTREQVKKLIADREADGWKTLYLGANVEEFSEAAGLGVLGQSALGYVPTSQGINSMYSALSCNVSNARAMYQASELAGLSDLQVSEQVKSCYNFSDAQRTAAKKIFDGTWDGTSKTVNTLQTKKNDEEPKPPTT